MGPVSSSVVMASSKRLKIGMECHYPHTWESFSLALSCNHYKTGLKNFTIWKKSQSQALELRAWLGQGWDSPIKQADDTLWSGFSTYSTWLLTVSPVYLKASFATTPLRPQVAQMCLVTLASVVGFVSLHPHASQQPMCPFSNNTIPWGCSFHLDSWHCQIYISGFFSPASASQDLASKSGL